MAMTITLRNNTLRALTMLSLLLGATLFAATPALAEKALDEGTTTTEHVTTGSEHAAVDGEHKAEGSHATGHHEAPNLIWILPFVILLLCIAILPLMHSTEEWWEKNSSKLLVAGLLAVVTSIYYVMRANGFHDAAPGLDSLKLVLNHAVIADYIPFIVLLFSLYTISGGINLSGDIPAHPITNTAIIGIGTLLASFIGTTGVAMLLIRPLLQINSERTHIKHTVIFFIFLVCNIGGSLLPIGDPPLFLGYLRGVPFLWTFHITAQWAVCSGAVLIVYFIWDSVAYSKEDKLDLALDEAIKEPVRLRGTSNFILLLGVVLAVALLVPGKPFLNTSWIIPNFLREGVQIGLAILSMVITQREVRKANDFNFVAIGEVACLFIGIFITMQVPIEILNIKGAELGLQDPWHFFWATGILSGFLDNAPTYVVYFSTAGALPIPDGVAVLSGLDFGAGTFDGQIAVDLLKAISCGAVFMGALTYIGNGPNFMVKSIAEQNGVKMPSFFGYMAYSIGVLIPIFVIITFIFFK